MLHKWKYLNVNTSSILFIMLFISSVYLLIDYLEHQNMINNGYINKKATHILIKETSETNQLNKLVEMDTPLLIYQYNQMKPELKYVYINSEDIVLPPFKDSTTLKRIMDLKVEESCLSIKGTYSQIELPNCKVIDEFDTPNSIQLLNETWVFQGQLKVDIDLGRAFVIQSPIESSKKLLNKISTSKKASWNFIDMESKGSFLLRSNQILFYTLHIGAYFAMIILIVLQTYHIQNQRTFVKILHISGFNYLKIWRGVYFIPLLSIFLVLLILLIGFYLFCFVINFNTWSNHSFNRSAMIAAMIVVYYGVTSFCFTIIQVYKKGNNL